MEEQIIITNPLKELSGTIELPGSKSESNRALIINALSGNKSKLLNLSASNDTKILQEALLSDNHEINVQDAGTAMRFLLAYFTATKQDKILTGNSRMNERPIGPLVDAMRSMGANIEYLRKPGYPPVQINGSKSIFDNFKLSIPADISSQFISALLMIAPVMPGDLEIEMEGKISSMPYIEMTLHIMRHFGIASERTNNIIIVKKQDYTPLDYTIESDWSCASYWYAMSAFAGDPAVFLEGLKRESFQGDSIIQEWIRPFGVITEFSDTGAFVTKGNEDLSKLPSLIDFSDYPDLAQTIIVICAVKGLKCKFTGMDSLKIKETDRIQALQKELAKFDVILNEETKGIFSLEGNFDMNASPTIETYYDHRMAMAFATLALYCREIKINNPSCVNKSYPDFWSDIVNAGFHIRY